MKRRLFLANLASGALPLWLMRDVSATPCPPPFFRAIGGTTTSTSCPAIAGLDFQGSTPTNQTVRFEFSNPLPIYPATYIWKLKPRQKAGYYTTFFWGNNGDFWWNNGAPDSYYGAHPYPQPPPDGTTHNWELAVDAGDEVNDDNNNDTTVQYDRWFTQALVVQSIGSEKEHKFYWDLSTNPDRVITYRTGTNYGNIMPPSPVLVFGDAPWNEGNEMLDGILRGIQIYSTPLNLQDIQLELTNPLSTQSGSANIWYLNLNPTPNDITDKSGSGHHPTWVGSGRPLQWAGP